MTQVVMGLVAYSISAPGSAYPNLAVLSLFAAIVMVVIENNFVKKVAGKGAGGWRLAPATILFWIVTAIPALVFAFMLIWPKTLLLKIGALQRFEASRLDEAKQDYVVPVRLLGGGLFAIYFWTFFAAIVSRAA